MNDDTANFTDSELEQSLIDLGRHFSYPPTPDVARTVESRLQMETRSPLLPPQRFASLRKRGLGVLAMFLVAGIVLSASPMARAAIAEWLGIPGTRIIIGRTALPPVYLRGNVPLGRRVTLDVARTTVSFHIFLPTVSGFSQPDEAFLDTFPPGGRLSLVYKARPGLPQTWESGVGVLLTEFPATAGEVFMGKSVGWRSIPKGIRVGVNRGYWIKGDHLTFIYRTIGDRKVWSSSRPAGNTLLWERAGLILRLESALPERAALRIATSMR